MPYSKDNPEGLIEFKKRRSQAVKDWRERTKKKIIQSMGGSCQICGYDRFHQALELHHLDPSEKEKGIADLMARPSNPSTYFKELRKCVLLCSNCHREVHGGIVCVPENYFKFDENVFTDFNTPKIKDRKKVSRKKLTITKEEYLEGMKIHGTQLKFAQSLGISLATLKRYQKCLVALHLGIEPS